MIQKLFESLCSWSGEIARHSRGLVLAHSLVRRREARASGEEWLEKLRHLQGKLLAVELPALTWKDAQARARWEYDAREALTALLAGCQRLFDRANELAGSLPPPPSALSGPEREAQVRAYSQAQSEAIQEVQGLCTLVQRACDRVWQAGSCLDRERANAPRAAPPRPPDVGSEIAAASQPANQGQQPDDRSQQHSIRRASAVWEVTFGEERGTFPTADYSAFEMVVELLQRPRKSLDLQDLVDHETRILLKQPGSQDDLNDSEGLNRLKRRWEEIAQEREGEDDPLVLRELEHEMAKISAELRKAVGPSGRKRKLGRSTTDTVWDTTTKKVRRLWERLGNEDMPKFAQHLQTSIKIDRPTLTYAPPGDTITWHIEL